MRGRRSERLGSRVGTRYKPAIRRLSRTRCQVGPTILFDAPARIPHPLFHPIPLWARHSVETNAEPTCDGRGSAGGIFPTVVGGQVEDVEEAAVTEKRWPSSERRRIGIDTPYTARYAG